VGNARNPYFALKCGVPNPDLIESEAKIRLDEMIDHAGSPQGAAAVRGAATGVAARAARVAVAIGATSKASGAPST
jgi:hypothetical protein